MIDLEGLKTVLADGTDKKVNVLTKDKLGVIFLMAKRNRIRKIRLMEFCNLTVLWL